jgi:single-stranded-DNA-specific exonuclease
LPAHRLAEVIELRGGHIKAILLSSGGARVEAMAFRAGGRPLGEALMRLKGQNIHAAGTLAIDQWGGRPKVTFRLMDVAGVG